MDYQKLTEKSLSAISQAEQTAREYGNPQIEQSHLLYALLVQDNGLIPEVLKNVGVDAQNLANDVKKENSLKYAVKVRFTFRRNWIRRLPKRKSKLTQ